METEIANDASAVLESLFNSDTDAFYGSAGFVDNGDESLQGTAICQKVVDDQHMVIRPQKLAGNNDVVLTFMCERFDLCLIDVAVDVDALGFFR